MYTVIAIRNLDESFRWNGSYYVGTKEHLSEAIKLAKEERKARGYHKYGCVIYSDVPDSTQVYCLFTGYEEGIVNEAYKKLLDETKETV